MFFITNDNRLLQGKTKVEALQQICPYIYWKGNNPYGVEFVQSKHKIVCWRVNSKNISLKLIPAYLSNIVLSSKFYNFENTT